MAPRKGAVATLASMVDDYSDDDFAQSDPALPTPDSQAENKMPTKRRAAAAAPTKGKAGVAGARVVKSKATSRRASTESVTAKAKSRKPAVSRSRKALEVLDNVNNVAEDTEEVDEFDEVPTMPTKKGRVAKSAPKTSANTIAGRTTKRAGSVQPLSRGIPDTQPELARIDQTMLDEEDVTVLPARASSRPVAAPLPAISSSRPGRSNSRQAQESLFATRKRAGSASSTERNNDPTLRRKLGDLTKRFESLDLKYRQLKEVGSSDATSNFDKLKRSTDQRSGDQDDIIVSLKKELAAQKALLAETKTLRTQVAALEADNARLKAESKSLSATVATSQNETKALSAKLAAARSSVQPEHRAIPGSAVKARGNANLLKGTAAEEQQIMKLKEELYSDLTGLMIRNVKRSEEEDVYDCIQTGRNGTLHFHLSISHLPPECVTPGPTNSAYDDTEFGYLPLLDEKNDRELLDILPDYLTEDIIFPRSQAAKFFTKMSEAMSRKVELED